MALGPEGINTEGTEGPLIRGGQKAEDDSNNNSRQMRNSKDIKRLSYTEADCRHRGTTVMHRGKNF